MNWIGIGAVYRGIEPKVKREGGQRFVFVAKPLIFARRKILNVLG
jgi:hypothetical protein